MSVSGFLLRVVLMLALSCNAAAPAVAAVQLPPAASHSAPSETAVSHHGSGCHDDASAPAKAAGRASHADDTASRDPRDARHAGCAGCASKHCQCACMHSAPPIALLGDALALPHLDLAHCPRGRAHDPAASPLLPHLTRPPIG